MGQLLKTNKEIEDHRLITPLSVSRSEHFLKNTHSIFLFLETILRLRVAKNKKASVGTVTGSCVSFCIM